MNWQRHARRVIFPASAIILPLARAADDARVIFPGAGTAPEAAAPHTSASPLLTLLGILVLGGAGVYIFWKSRGARGGAPRGGRLAISETKSLGNRQFLVVASYDDKKFLLGVCPGKIELLAPLSAPIENAVEKFSL